MQNRGELRERPWWESKNNASQAWEKITFSEGGGNIIFGPKYRPLYRVEVILIFLLTILRYSLRDFRSLMRYITEGARPKAYEIGHWNFVTICNYSALFCMIYIQACRKKAGCSDLQGKRYFNKQTGQFIWCILYLNRETKFWENIFSMTLKMIQD